MKNTVPLTYEEVIGTIYPIDDENNSSEEKSVVWLIDADISIGELFESWVS